MRFVSAGDSGVVASSQFKVYLLRTSTLLPRGANFALGWKTSPRGAVDGARPDDSTPSFAEMAAPGYDLRRRLEREEFFPATGSAALHPLARTVRPRQDLRSRQRLFRRPVDVAAAIRFVGRHGLARSESGGTWRSAWKARAPTVRACSPSAGAADSPRRAPGWIRPTRITARSCSNSPSTIARWRQICPSRRPARSCSSITSRLLCPAGWNWP